MTRSSLADGDSWPFRFLARVPYHPDNLDDWLEGINDQLLREVDALEVNQSESVSFHIGGISK